MSVNIELKSLPFFSNKTSFYKQDEESIKNYLVELRFLFKKEKINSIDERDRIFYLIDKLNNIFSYVESDYFHKVAYLRQAEKFLYSEEEILLSTKLKSKILVHFKTSEIKNLKKISKDYVESYKNFKSFITLKTDIELFDLIKNIKFLYSKHRDFALKFSDCFTEANLVE